MLEKEIYEIGTPCSKCIQSYKSNICENGLCVGDELGNLAIFLKFKIRTTFNQKI